MILSEIFTTEKERYSIFLGIISKILEENSDFEAMINMLETKKSVIIYFKKKKDERFSNNPMSLYGAHISDNFYNHLYGEKKQNALDTLYRILTKSLQK